MPYIIRPRRVYKFATTLLAAASLGVAVPAVASAACPSEASSPLLSKLGDAASYTLLPGGSFESGAPGWSLTNAAVAAGNESYNIVPGSHSLAIQPNGVAVSPSFCVSVEKPMFRFFLKQTSGSWAVLNVVLRWTDAAGFTHDTTVGSLQTGTSWRPSQALQLGSTLPLWMANATLNARLVFKPEAYGGAWAIDDVLVDPYRR